MRKDEGKTVLLIALVVLLLLIGGLFAYAVGESDLPFWVKFWILR